MSGFFGVVSRDDCVPDLFYGTDYHSHLGTVRGGLAVWDGKGFSRVIHDITNAQFRSKFEDDLPRLAGDSGIGIISDHEDQPLLISSHHGRYAIVTVGRLANLDELVAEILSRPGGHLSEMSRGEPNPTEVVANLIDRGDTLEDGIASAQEAIRGSCSILLLTEDGLYVARDRLGRTPAAIGRKPGAYAATLESCAFPNIGYELERDLGPGEIVRLTAEGVERLRAPGDELKICAFMWVYYGYPASSYEGVNVEAVRYRCGERLARRDEDVEPDRVAGIPDSGTGHAVGYANATGIPYCRPFVKYTPTWPRSFMPQDQRVRDLVARMKLIPIREVIDGRRLLFCEDSIVRGTQLQDIIRRIFKHGAVEVHMRPACPPLVFSCPFLNFSRSSSELDLAARRAIAELEGDGSPENLREYADDGTDLHAAMVEKIGERLELTSLRYQRLDDMIDAIGLPRERVCTFCWSGDPDCWG